MTDVHTREQRSRNMAAIRSRNTKPEVRVRRVLHAMGFPISAASEGPPGKAGHCAAEISDGYFSCMGAFGTVTVANTGLWFPVTRAEFGRRSGAGMWRGIGGMRWRCGDWVGGLWWCGSVRCGRTRRLGQRWRGCRLAKLLSARENGLERQRASR